MLALGDLAGAVNALRNAVRLNSANADAAVDLASTLSKSGDAAGALL